MRETCECGEKMENLGNISGLVYSSNPPQWDEVWICRTCKKKRTVRVYGELPEDYLWVRDYEEIKNR